MTTPAYIVGTGTPDGSSFGAATTSLISFYGVTPVVQPSAVTAVNTTAATSTTNAYGYTTAAQADAIITAVNLIITRLQTLGLTA